MTIISPLELARRQQGLKQIELAKIAGIPNSRLSLIENGYREPTPEEVKRLRKVLKVKNLF